MRRKKYNKIPDEQPYYRIQYWDGFSFCWVDVPKNFDDPEKAEKFLLVASKRYRLGDKYRIIEVRQGVRNIFKTSE